MTDLIRLVYLAGAPAALVFPVYYHMTARWYNSREGRLLMLLASLPFCLYLSAAIAILLPAEVVKNILRLVLVTLASVVSWSLLLVYRRIRRDGLNAIQSRKQEQEQEQEQE